MARIIDAHQHFWNRSKPFNYAWLDAPNKSSIRHDHLPEDLEPQLRENGVDATICVQTQHNLEENRWALRLAQKHALIAGVVGWVDLASPDCEQQLLEFKDHPKFVGIRHITQDEPDDDFIVRPDVMNGLRVLEKHRVPFDLLFYVKHLKHVSRLANELPELPMVIDHLGKPNIRDKQFEVWEKTFREAGRFPNVYCKLSGLVTEADWQHWNAFDLAPYIQTALKVFGPERCMFGSDWPVCKLAGSYARVKDALTSALGPLGVDDARAIFGGTAEHFYRLR